MSSLYEKEAPYLSDFAKKYISFLKEQGNVDDEFALELAIRLFGEENIYELED